MNYKDATQRIFFMGEQASTLKMAEIRRNYLEALKQIKSKVDKLYSNIPNIESKKYYDWAIKSNRLNSLLKSSADALKKEYAKIASIVLQNSIDSFTNSYYLNQYLLNWLLPPQLKYFSFVDMRAVQMSVWYTADVWNRIKNEAIAGIYKPMIPQWAFYKDIPGGKVLRLRPTTLKQLLKNNLNKQLLWVRDTITQGLIQGRSNQQMTSILKETFSKNYRNTKRVVRTETIRNMNAGSFLNYLEAKNQGANLIREWSAVLNTRTRSQSAQMDGQKADDLGMFHYPNGAISRFPGGSGTAAYDINERCTVIQYPQGLNPEIRIARNPATGKNEAIEYRSFSTWADENNLVYKNGIWARAA